jgi:ubiquinone/menaquinone biosynthesis C-methylase UbiE
LARKGYRCFGADIAWEGLKIAREKVKSDDAYFVQANVLNLPFSSNCFDVVVSFGVLDHMLFKSAERGIEEVHRVLKASGLFYLTLRSSRDKDYGRGEELEKGTFIIPEEAEASLPQHFYTGEEIERLLNSKFKILHIEADERHIGIYLSIIYSRWIIFAQKI